MATGAHTFDLRETFAEPQVLPPPPVRHALFAFLVTLAAILHLGTAGWTEIHNGAEGLYASSGRSFLASPDEPPVLRWLLAGSYNLLGVGALAARVPIALAFVGCVALTFLIGERLAGYWRGFVAGMILLSSCGAYAWGRFVTPEPIFALCVAAAIFCALAGYQRKQTRRRWFAAFWLCAAAAYLTRGAYALLVLSLVIGLPALSFREARMRFAGLFHWSAVPLFIIVAGAWLWFVQTQTSESLLRSVWIAPLAIPDIRAQLRETTILQFLSGQIVWLFPALLLVLPLLLLAWRKVIRPQEFDFTDALPLAWTLAALLPIFFAARQQYDTLAMWSGFALFAASAWDRSPARPRLVGIALVAVAGIVAALAIARGKLRLPSLGHAAFQPGDQLFLTLVAVAIAVCCAAATYLVWNRRDTLAIATLLIAAVPIGLGAVESIARHSPYLSFARIAPFLTSEPAQRAELIFEGRREAASSLDFYTPHRVTLVSEASTDTQTRNPVLTPADVLERMAQPQQAYLIIHKDRVPWWQAELTRRFHIYHQVASCGSHVVVNNRP
jgi:4-amino-4-deoxy-L-arabinose transferase-like glycosyltransferase